MEAKLIEIHRDAELLALAMKHARQDEGKDRERMLERAAELAQRLHASLEEMVDD